MRLLVIAALVLVGGCSIATVKDPATGEKISVANQALAMAEKSAAECVVHAGEMNQASQTNMLSMIAKLEADVQPLIVQSFMFLNQQAVSKQIGACMAQMETIARVYQLTDQQKIASNTRIAGSAIAWGAGAYLGKGLFDAISTGLATGGNVYVASQGGIIQDSSAQAMDTGSSISALNGGDTTQPLQPTGQGGPPGAVSTSGSNYNGNVQTISISKTGASTSSTSIPNNSPDPVIDSPSSTEGPSSPSEVRANP